jgi:enhancing lycopene biosynthesis protein 2
VIDHLRGHRAGRAAERAGGGGPIARGQIADVRQARAKDLMRLMPGLGRRTTWRRWDEGGGGEVNPEVGAAAVLKMHAAQKPIGAICIAPLVVAKVPRHPRLTVGDDAGAEGRWACGGA